MLQARPGAGQLARYSLSNGDDEACTNEDADFAEVVFFAFIVIARGPQDDQLHTALVRLHLGSEVELLRVLNGEGMQTECLPDVFEFGQLGLEQTYLDKPALIPPIRRLLDRQ